MANSKLIIIEGPQGAGKTTYSDHVRNSIPYTNLYRLSGTSDSSIEGKKKAKEMYYHLLDYIEGLQNKSINLVFDRTFFTEENYCRLGKKDYSFTDVYDELLERLANMDFDIYYITLYLSDTEEYQRRLERSGKGVVKYSKFSIENSISQQNMYLEMSEEIKKKYPQIHVVNVDTCRDIEDIKEELTELLKWKE